MKRRDLRSWTAWCKMKMRCTNKKSNRAKYYIEKGITFDPSWDKFDCFYADMGDCPDGYQLDRIDNDGNYCKSNCHWVHPRDNVRNRSISKLTVRKVRLIRALFRSKKDKCSVSKMARLIAPLFGCSIHSIRKVESGINWPEVR